MTDFLDNLYLTDDERQKLRGLGVKTPLGLLALRKIATKVFDNYVGVSRAPLIANQMKELLTAAELHVLNQPSRGRFSSNKHVDAHVEDDGPR